jgi:hypothetical protein
VLNTYLLRSAVRKHRLQGARLLAVTRAGTTPGANHKRPQPVKGMLLDLQHVKHCAASCCCVLLLFLLRAAAVQLGAHLIKHSCWAALVPCQVHTA